MGLIKPPIDGGFLSCDTYHGCVNVDGIEVVIVPFNRPFPLLCF